MVLLFSRARYLYFYFQVNLAFAHILMSYIAGYFATLLFESPFMILQRLIFEGSLSYFLITSILLT